MVDRREHQYVNQRLSPYIDQELSNRERARVEAHLSTCAECRTDLHSLRWTKHLLQQTPPVKVPRSFVIREADLVPERRPRRGFSVFGLQWATAVVALLFVLVLGVDLMTGVRGRVAEPPMVALRTQETEAAQEEGPMMQLAPDQEETPSFKLEMAATPTAAPTPERPEQEDMVRTPKEGEGRGIEAETPTPAPEQEAAPMAQAVPPEADAATPEAEQALESTPKEAETQEAPVEPDGPEPVRERTAARLGWWIAEIVLGVALVGLLLAVVILRRQA